MNSFAKFMEILLAVAIFFVIPLMYFELKQTELLQRKLQQKSEQFLETVKNNGALSMELYETFLREVSIPGCKIHVDMVLERVEYYPEAAGIPAEGLQAVSCVIAKYGNRDIKKALQSGAKIRIQQEERLTLRIYGLPHTLQSLVSGLFRKQGAAMLLVQAG